MSRVEDRPPDLPGKVVAALDRLSRALRAHRQTVATEARLTPLQADLLRVIAGGSPPPPSAGALAGELGVRQPTVSDSLDALERKGLIRREPSAADRRSSIAVTTRNGRARAGRLSSADEPLRSSVAQLTPVEQEQLLGLLLGLIEVMLDRGVIDVARTCTTCRFFRSDAEGQHCALLEIPLRGAELRVDCPEHEPRPAA